MSLWLTFKWDWGLFGLWWGLTVGMVSAVAFGTCVFLSANWEEEVDRAMARLAVDKGYQQERRDEECTYIGDVIVHDA